jgi:hypothetical protein
MHLRQEFRIGRFCVQNSISARFGAARAACLGTVVQGSGSSYRINLTGHANRKCLSSLTLTRRFNLHLLDLKVTVRRSDMNPLCQPAVETLSEPLSNLLPKRVICRLRPIATEQLRVKRIVWSESVGALHTRCRNSLLPRFTRFTSYLMRAPRLPLRGTCASEKYLPYKQFVFLLLKAVPWFEDQPS